MSTEWIEVSLKDICENKSVACKNFEEENIERYVGLEHLEPESLVISSWGLVKDGTTFTKLFYPGQVLFGKRRSYQKKAAVADFKGVCSGDILVLEAKEDIILRELLPYIIQNERLFDYAVGTSSGSLSPRTSWRLLSSYKLKIPLNRESQKEILEKFTKIEEAIKLKGNLKFTTQKYKESLLNHLLTYGINNIKTTPKKNEDIPVNWSLKKLGDIATLRTEKFNPLSADTEKYIALEHIEPISGKILGYEDSKESTSLKAKFKEGDVLFGKLRPYLRKYWYAEFDGVCATEILPLIAKSGTDKKFLFYTLQQEKVIGFAIQNSFGTKMPRTSWADLKNIKLAIPPKEEQQEIANILSNLDKQVFAYEKEIELSISIKKALQEQLLTSREGVKL
ncbi:restriction endonuclease subunit S [Exiguobacterium aurantiacum]|uniref:Restriction endonuclease subunit S n=1 Tax=Exiguobacterium aurantiacum TaxID=33987 RepID=A0ABY5FSN8_9BACL|nr:restriction endonuclease subunit S [Exiguobacterium aurantiacum]UTT44545.1 restriction endonuclease subunit S [Exiguobacterium aurantiacum]